MWNPSRASVVLFFFFVKLERQKEKTFPWIRGRERKRSSCYPPPCCVDCDSPVRIVEIVSGFIPVVPSTFSKLDSKMELSNVGDRVFAAERILKKRIRRASLDFSF